ncbi:hypothetical protein T440DRAFT_234999 [Plenodomus tracheiphilus IPT5]|uniref:Uncharacterized protein n=1 Tax=Plenodomus tracheiphilus IPT5 TaxID=1408161 RepID=A0A6A7BJD2_9PLEO|nr:hypothetical protein T440DRAFT_234999 [Plenodomus tracheiphilus IPT5]
MVSILLYIIPPFTSILRRNMGWDLFALDSSLCLSRNVAPSHVNSIPLSEKQIFHTQTHRTHSRDSPIPRTHETTNQNHLPSPLSLSFSNSNPVSPPDPPRRSNLSLLPIIRPMHANGAVKHWLLFFSPPCDMHKHIYTYAINPHSSTKPPRQIPTCAIPCIL